MPAGFRVRCGRVRSGHADDGMQPERGGGIQNRLTVIRKQGALRIKPQLRLQQRPEISLLFGKPQLLSTVWELCLFATWLAEEHDSPKARDALRSLFATEEV